MNDIDNLLRGAGERWRATQSESPAVDPAVFTVRTRPSATRFLMVTSTGIAAVVVICLGAMAVGPGRAPGVGGPPAAGPTLAPGVADASPSAAPEASQSVPFTCDVTRPTDPLVPPDGYPAEPPPGYGSEWYGTPALWTTIDRNGETWAHLPATPDGLSQKTWWWSTDWVPEADPVPDITVVGTRLDAPGTFEANHATNATAGSGTAMLVGVTVPTPGCWRLTGTYLDASLSIVVDVKGD
jgi:hypothetical protein